MERETILKLELSHNRIMEQKKKTRQMKEWENCVQIISK